MPNRRTPPIEIPAPFKGLDTGTGFSNQPAFTSSDLLNVRAYESRDRYSLGKRPGTERAITDQGGSPASRRITGLAVLTQAQAAPTLANSTQVVVSEDWSTLSTGDPVDWSTSSANGLNYTCCQVTADRSINSTIHSIDGSSRLAMDFNASAVNAVACQFFVNQDMTVTVEAGDTMPTTNSHLTDNLCDKVGPAIRVSNQVRSGVFATLEPTGTADEVVLRISEFNNGNTVTTLATSSSPHTLAGTGSGTSEFTIRLRITAGDTVEASVNWPNESYTDTLTATTTQSATQFRGALVASPTGGGANANARLVTQWDFTKLVPAAYSVSNTLDPDSSGPGAFYLPTKWRGVSFDGSTYTITADNPSSGTTTDYPSIDTIDNHIEGDEIDNVSATAVHYAAYTNDVGFQEGIDWQFDPSNTDSEDCISPVFRMSEDSRDGLIIGLDWSNDSNGKRALSYIQLYSIIDGTLTELGNALTNGTTNRGPDYEFEPTAERDGIVRMTDDGAIIRIYFNGILVLEIDPTQFINWDSSIGTALEGNTGTGFAMGTDIDGGTSPAQVGQVRIVAGESGQTAVDISAYEPELLVMSDNLFQIANLEDDTLENVTGSGLQNALPNAISFNKKFYAVDGAGAFIVDPSALTSTDYASEVTSSGKGSLPANCELIALYRGRIVLARQDTDPTIWYMSRVFDPLDWDFNAEPLATAPYAGNNAAVGKPGEAITALIPFADDYLIFGGAKSMYMMEGDPGYGGQVQLMSNSIGVTGPRAWTFDDNGNLYFHGSSGLYRLARGSLTPENVSGRRVANILDRIDASSTLVELAFDSFRQEVHVFLVPADGSTGATSIVYDVPTDTFWRDKYIFRTGPWGLTETRGNTDELRRFIMGGNNGYLYRHDDQIVVDDSAGTSPAPIDSYVRFKPIELDRGLQETMLTEFRVHGAPSNSTMNWFWLSAQTPADLESLVTPGTTSKDATLFSSDVSGTIFGDSSGWQQSRRVRARNGTLQFVLQHISTASGFQIERIQGFVGPVGNRRT